MSSVNNVSMYSMKHSSQSHFQLNSFLLINVANLNDQLEPVAKSAWGNLWPLREILDRINLV